ncbi:MAG: Valine--tRNA ligase [Phycisphaerae bacterium]|nr:Valine--tRNA ligase [Phycisphaerae bacterium]
MSSNAAPPAGGGTYDPRAIEPGIYALWERGGYFHAEPDTARQPFTIVIPPPNVTGALHLGHALNNTCQDILIRARRMQGYDAEWMPGTDHAGIATQAVVEKRLKQEQKLTRHELGREGLVRKIWEWKEEYNARIIAQLRKMGFSCDWERSRFTLDEVCARAVYELFFRMFRDGLIYRGLRMVNWDAALQTAVADDEIVHETVKGHLWHIRYPIEQSDGATEPRSDGATERRSDEGRAGVDYLVVATTRPETMLADTAVAVHPDDERYKHLIGKRCILPLMNRPIPIVADGLLVNKEFGTGCVKITPGHDPNDYACWQRHQGHADEFAIIDLLTPDGKINENGRAQGAGRGAHEDATGVAHGAGDKERGVGRDYAGMKKEDARKQVVADLEALGLLEKVEDYVTDVGHSDRSKTPIEPLRSEQWFVKTGDLEPEHAARVEGLRGAPGLAQLAIEAVRGGEVQFFPARYASTYLDWLGEKRDWCISRQLWWGHRIPVWRREWGGWESESQAAEALLRELERDHRAEVVVSRDQESSRTSLELSEHVGDVFDVETLICIRTPNSPLARRLEAVGFVQDPDVLDTWFSSSLWPLSTFGWPHDLSRDPTDPSRDREGAVSGPSAEAPHSPSRDPTDPSRDREGAVSMPSAEAPSAERPSSNRAEIERGAGGARNPLPHGRGSDPSRARAGDNAPPALPDGRGSGRNGSGRNPSGADSGDADDAGSIRPTPADFDYFFPTDVLTTARGIITLWVARMVMCSKYLTGQRPFRHVYIHPIIQDGQGRTMSKSLGNGVDPLDLIELYGTDALRFVLAQMATETQDIRMPVKPVKLPDGRTVNGSDKFELGRNFCNKLWQAATGFVLPNVRDVEIGERRRDDGAEGPRGQGVEGPRSRGTKGPRDLFDRWILSRLQRCIRSVTDALDQYQFQRAADAIYAFFWGDFCDWYIEEAKVRLTAGHAGTEARRREGDDGATKRRSDGGSDEATKPRSHEGNGAAQANDVKTVLLHVLDSTLCLMHPFMPFITEALWQKVGEAVPGHAEWIERCQSRDREGAVSVRSAEAPSAERLSSDRAEIERRAGGAKNPLPYGRGSDRPERGSGANDGHGSGTTRGSGVGDRSADAPLIVTAWPRVRPELIDEACEREVSEVLQPVIRALRDIRTQVNTMRAADKQPSIRNLPHAAIRAAGERAEILRRNGAMIRRLGTCEQIEIGPEVAKPRPAASKVLSGMEVYVPLAGLADPEIERRRLEKDLGEVSAAIQRVEAKLADATFVDKAPAAVVEKERQRAAELCAKLAAIREHLGEIGA